MRKCPCGVKTMLIRQRLVGQARQYFCGMCDLAAPSDLDYAKASVNWDELVHAIRIREAGLVWVRLKKVASKIFKEEYDGKLHSESGEKLADAQWDVGNAREAVFKILEEE